MRNRKRTDRLGDCVDRRSADCERAQMQYRFRPRRLALGGTDVAVRPNRAAALLRQLQPNDLAGQPGRRTADADQRRVGTSEHRPFQHPDGDDSGTAAPRGERNPPPARRRRIKP